MFGSLILAGLAAFLMVSPASAKPSGQAVAKWGPYAALVEQEWWADLETGRVFHYRWAVPDEEIRLEIFSSDGQHRNVFTYRMDDGVFVNQGISRAQIARLSARLIEYRGGTRLELSEEGGSYKQSYVSSADGQPKEDAYYVTRAPRFPDTGTLREMRSKVHCPPDRNALERFLARLRVKSSRAERTAAHAMLVGQAGEVQYHPGDTRFLGVKPLSIKTAIIGGRPHGLEVMLPGLPPSRYEPQFRAAFGHGYATCNRETCNWYSRKDSWNEAPDRLNRATLSGTIMDEKNTRLLCDYR